MQITHKLETFKTAVNLPRSGHPSKFTPRFAKHPRATSQTLQASVSMLNVKVHDSTIRNRQNKYGLFQEKSFHNKNMVKFHLKKKTVPYLVLNHLRVIESTINSYVY